MEGSSAVPVKLLKIEPKGRKLESGEVRQGLARQIAREVHKLLSSPDDALKFGLRMEIFGRLARTTFLF